MIRSSQRLDRVKRVFDPYLNRRDFVRLDRNEDPVGWEPDHFNRLLQSIEPYDLAAYSDSTSFIQKLSRWLNTKPRNIYVTAGSDAAIKNIFETYVDDGDVVVLQKPSWRMYDVYNNVYRGDPFFVAYDDNLCIDTDRILQSLGDKRIRMLIIANPNQPTGTIIEQKTLKEIIRVAYQHDTVVVVDEAYFLFSQETCLPLIEEYSNLIVVRTFSKAFGLASLRLGYCVANGDRVKDLMLLRPVTDANGIALKIGEYALDHMDWILKRVDTVIKGREYLYEQFLSHGLRTFKSHANFVLLKYGSYDQAVNVISRSKERRFLLKGPFNFSPLENCVRVTVGPENLMHEFWKECKEILTNGT